MMNKKISKKFFAAVLLAALLTGCNQSEESAETLSAEATVSESETAAVGADVTESETLEETSLESKEETNVTTQSEATEEEKRQFHLNVSETD